ncbi:hypothetical protein M0811_03884 [Anaeramoeba ignava]|uniref:Transmembrane protein n=1 Tax=Anaeramoeba ignava TaxID=1746090 RepID=A0A9Q0RJ28_ANAIG|nr:hypothetical protein M0811_03884 [Anaeramoeba ignava]
MNLYQNFLNHNSKYLKEKFDLILEFFHFLNFLQNFLLDLLVNQYQLNFLYQKMDHLLYFLLFVQLFFVLLVNFLVFFDLMIFLLEFEFGM